MQTNNLGNEKGAIDPIAPPLKYTTECLSISVFDKLISNNMMSI